MIRTRDRSGNATLRWLGHPRNSLLRWVLGRTIMVLVTATPACGAARATVQSCPASDFTTTERAFGLADGMAAALHAAAPEGSTCGLLVSSAMFEGDHALYVVPSGRSPRAVLVALKVERGAERFEAPLYLDTATKLAAICQRVVMNRRDCLGLGVDGVSYLMSTSTPGGEQAAYAWSPRVGTEAAMVVGVFEALRAYVAAPEPLRQPAFYTLYNQVYAASAALGLEGEGPEPRGRREPPRAWGTPR